MLPVIAQGVANRTRGDEDTALLADALGGGPGQAPLQACAGEAAGGPISGPAGADVSSSQGSWDRNARGRDVALVLTRVRVAGRARVTSLECVGRVREGRWEESEEEERSEDGFHGWRLIEFGLEVVEVKFSVVKRPDFEVFLFGKAAERNFVFRGEVED